VTRSWPVAGGVFGVIWVFVHGPPLSPEPLAGSLLVGLAVGFPMAFVFRRLYGETVDLGRSVRGVPYMVLYTLAFIREAVVASIDVTYRVLAPSGPVEPEVILIPLRVQTDLGVTTIANSITMTPGSLTLDYDPEENALYVHVIDGSAPDDIVDPIRVWENYALVIFDEDLSPGDPAPDFAVYPPDQTHPVLEQAVPETETEAESEVEAEVEAETDTDSEAGAEAETDTDSEAEVEAETDTDSEAGAEVETDTDSEAETEMDSKAGTESDAEAEPPTEDSGGGDDDGR
jgi:multicomponent Na+:H+ antiporter subunit E